MALPVTITGISTAVAPVGPFKLAAGSYSGAIVVDTSSIVPDTTLSIQGIGNSGAATAQTFTNGPQATDITSVSFWMTRTGTPTDGVYADITNTNPSGTVLSTSNTIPASSITATTIGTANLITFTFSTPASIAANATFAVRVYRTGAASSSNLFNTTGRVADNYAGGSVWTLNSLSSWNATTAADTRAIVYGTKTIASDAYYFFGRDGTTTTTLQAYKSTAPDTSWASIATKTGFTTAILNIAAYQVGSVIHMAVMDGTANTSVATKYVSFDTTTDTFLATVETVAAASAIAGQLAATAGHGCSIVVRSNGNAVLLYNGLQTNTSGTARARIYYRERTGLNTYGTATRVDANTGFDNAAPIAVLGSSDRVHFIWHQFLTVTAFQRHLTSANVLGMAGAIATTVKPNDIATYNDGGTIRHVGVAASTAATNQAFYWNSADNPVVSVVTVTFGTPARTVDDNGNVYVLLRYGDGDLYLKHSTDDGASWTGLYGAFVGTVTSDEFSLSKNQLVYQRGTNYVFPYIVNDSGTLKYNEYTVRTSGPTNYTLTALVGTAVGAGKSAALAVGRVLTSQVGTVVGAGQSATLTKSSPTLVAGVAVVVSQGRSATLRTARTVVESGAGAMSWTGKDAVLRVGRAVQAGVGTATVVGQSVTLKPTRAMPVLKGTVTVTGQNVTLTYTGTVANYPLVAVKGTVTVTGQSVAFKYGYKLVAVKGTAAVTGQAVTVTATRKLGATSGTVVMTGQASILRTRRALIVTSTTVAFAGQAAGLVGERRLTAVQGAVAVGGRSAVLRVGYKLVAGVGTAAFVGQNVSIRYGERHTLSAQLGTAMVGGQSVVLNYGRKLIVGAGTVVGSGQSAALGSGRKVIAAVGTAEFVGRQVTLRSVRRLVATSTTVSFAGQDAIFIPPAVVGGNGTPIGLLLSLTMTTGLVVGTPIGLLLALTKLGTGVVNYPLTALYGTVTLTGQTANVRYSGEGLRITTVVGTVAFAPQPITLRYNRSLGTNTGTITANGQTAELSRSGEIYVAGLKIWTGITWTAKPAKVWTGSAWVSKTVKHWNGVAWVPETPGGVVGTPMGLLLSITHNTGSGTTGQPIGLLATLTHS